MDLPFLVELCHFLVKSSGENDHFHYHTWQKLVVESEDKNFAQAMRDYEKAMAEYEADVARYAKELEEENKQKAALKAAAEAKKRKLNEQKSNGVNHEQVDLGTENKAFDEPKAPSIGGSIAAMDRNSARASRRTENFRYKVYYFPTFENFYLAEPPYALERARWTLLLKMSKWKVWVFAFQGQKTLNSSVIIFYIFNRICYQRVQCGGCQRNCFDKAEHNQNTHNSTTKPEVNQTGNNSIMETTSLASSRTITDADIKLVSSRAVFKDLNFLFHFTNQFSLKLLLTLQTA